MPRGWLKTALNRLRFVKAGYDADNLSLHPNNVIFDSGDNGTLSLVAAGSYSTSGYTTSGSYVQIASWSLPFIPLCTFQFYSPYSAPSGVPTLPLSPSLYQVADGGSPSLRVTAGGIFFRGTWAIEAAPSPLTIYYQAYRLGV